MTITMLPVTTTTRLVLPAQERLHLMLAYMAAAERVNHEHQMRLELFTTEQLHINSDKGTLESITAINSVMLTRLEKEIYLFRLLSATTCTSASEQH